MKAKTVAFCVLVLFVFLPPREGKTYHAEDARTDCAKNLSSRRNDPPALFAKLYCHAEDEDYAEARRYLPELLEKTAGIEDYLLYYEALFAHKSGESSKARTLYEKLLEKYPGSATAEDAREGLAETLAESGIYEEAEKMYESLARETRSRWARAIYLKKRGEILEKQGLLREAAVVFKEIWTRHPETSFSDRVLAFSAKNGTIFEPTRWDFFVRGSAFYRAKRWKSAVKALGKARQTRSVRMKTGISLYRLSKYPEALETFSGIDSPEAYYWRARTLQSMDRMPETIATLTLLPRLNPKTPYAPKSLFRAARLRQLERKFAEAEKLYGVILEKYPKTKYAKSSAWNLGWIHYKKGEYEKTLEVLSRYPGSKRFDYWRARTLEKTGDANAASELLGKLADSGNFSYYSYLAKLRLGQNTLPRGAAESGLPENPFGADPSVEKFLFFRKAGTYGPALREAALLEKKAKTTGEKLFLAALYAEAGNWNLSIKLSGNLDFPAADRFHFPKGFGDQVRFFAAEHGLDELLVYSLIREESRFDENAVSVSNARGLMQLMPSTAKETAKEVPERFFATSQLFSPRLNINLGCHYLKTLLDKFGGNVVASLAGYNGGPRNAEKWLAQRGELPLDEFVEEIPFKQSRNYVKKVMRSYGAYEAIYGRVGGRESRQSFEKFLRIASP